MCFSASVSFTASAVLAAAGISTLYAAQSKRELPFAAIPLLFATQQFIEGILWLTLPKAGFGPEEYWLTQLYAIFIGMVWPMLIPLSLSLIEPVTIKKRFMQAAFATGVIVAVYTLIVILKYGVSAELADECIIYQYPGEERHGILTVYIIATCSAYFLSSFRMVRWIGAANAAGLVIAYYFYRVNYASVWCFFAAILSGMIYLYIHHRHHHRLKPYFTA